MASRVATMLAAFRDQERTMTDNSPKLHLTEFMTKAQDKTGARVPGQLLLDGARELTAEESGGHGGRWQAFDEDVEGFFDRWLRPAVEKALVPELGVTDPGSESLALSLGEPELAGLLYTGDARNTGLMAVIEVQAKGESNVFVAGYPFFGDGAEYLATVDELRPHPNRAEARIDLALESGASLFAFDAMFWRHRGIYREGEHYRFMVSGLAYSMGPTESQDVVITDPEKIRAFRPDDPGNLEPVRIITSQMAALMPASSGPADDAGYHGEVVRVVPRAVRALDMDFWRVDTVVMRADDEDFVLPIYVAERYFTNDWRPRVGEYITGAVWVQAYLTERLMTQ